MIQFILRFKKTFLLIVVLSSTLYSMAQENGTSLKTDSLVQKMNMDAIYNRPFLTNKNFPIAIGGYIEANTNYAISNGVPEGFNFQMRRMTLFFSSTVSRKIKFLSELEFEDGTREINIETAVMDMEIHPLLTFRGGIVLNPIGAFNQNHDGPRWDFIDRPISATEIIPSTLSNVGFGIHGKTFKHNWTLGYEAYLTNGFNKNLILNEDSRTSFHAAKEDVNKFTQSASGLPMFTGKLAIRNRDIGELGLSYLSGVYNQFQKDGVQIDSKRRASLFAIDFNTSLLKSKLNITGEFVQAFIQLPQNYIQNYGSSQSGFYVDAVWNLLSRKMLGWDKAKLNLACRLDYVDYNLDKFTDSNQKIYDNTWAFTPAVAFRPNGTSVVRLNYKALRSKDVVGKVDNKSGILQFGLSTYF